jgi:CheY-like chemotaxis protein
MIAQPLTAVVVHPDAAVCDSTVQLLAKMAGWRVYGVPSGGDAVRVALATLPQLVLLDQDLQGMNGVATIASLRAHGIKCPVVALVQHGEHDCEHWKAQGYAGAVVLSSGREPVGAQLRALLDLPAS